MAIADFVLPTETIELPGGASFTVRGLSLQDVTVLIAKHGPTMEAFFRRYSEGAEASAMQIGMSLVGEAPALVAQIIALAADEPDMAPIVIKFPLDKQQEALEKLGRLTFDASGGPKKFAEAVVRLVKGTTNLMSEFSPSQIGS